MADESHSIQTYVSDMLALERHVRAPFETQAKDDDFSRYLAAGNAVQRLLTTSQRHVETLSNALEKIGGHEASPMKSAVAGFEGMVAGAIDKMRKTKVSKGLRDDYTALSLCCAGYTMLQTTALALGDHAIASVAEQHLRDYASCVMEIGRLLPEVVIQELRDIGLAVDESMAGPAQRAADNVWHSAATSTADKGTIGGAKVMS